MCKCRSIATPSRPSPSLSRPASDPSSSTLQGAPRSGDFASVLGLVQWAVINKIRFTGCRPDIRDGVRGVFATSDIGAGDNLVAVPLGSSLVVLPGERCPFPDFVPQDVWTGLPWYCQLACKLLHERRLGPASRFADYLPALPPRVDLPALWPREHVRRLQYPYLEQQILDEQDEWSRLYDTVRRHLDRRGLSREDLFWALACVRSRTFAGPHIPTPSAVKLLAGAAAAAAVAALQAAVGGSVGGTAAAAGADAVAAVLPAALAALGVPAAWQTVEARRAAAGEAGTVLYAVCPFIDMFNHDSRAQSECVFAPWKAEFRVVAGEGRRRGQQLLISYGNQSNDALLQRYGFVQLEGKQHDRYVLRDLVARLEAVLSSQLVMSREEVRAAAQAVDAPPGALDQVVLTSAGAPQQTRTAVAALLAAGRQAGSASLSPAAAVAAACAEEEMVLATSLQEDEEALAQLGRWEAWEAAAEERQAAAAAAAATAAAAAATAAAGEAASVETMAEAAGAADAQTERPEENASAAAGAERGEGAEDADDTGAVGQCTALVEEEPVLPPSELVAFGGEVERYRTVLAFRIAKKRVLCTLAR